jgi:hypothetical protein
MSVRPWEVITSATHAVIPEIMARIITIQLVAYIQAYSQAANLSWRKFQLFEQPSASVYAPNGLPYRVRTIRTQEVLDLNLWWDTLLFRLTATVIFLSSTRQIPVLYPD